MNLRKHLLPKLWCAGKLGNCPPVVNEFRSTCLFCRMRRRYLGKWTAPPYWISYTQPWAVKHYVLVNEKGQIVKHKELWRTLKIDPRGHFTMLRCAAIVALDRIMNKIAKVRYPLAEVCEFIANYPTW